MSVDCISSADNCAWMMATAKSVANADPMIAFICVLLFPGFVGCSAKFAILFRCFNVAPRPSSNILLFIKAQLPTDLCRRTEHQRARRNFCPYGDKSVCADDRPRADFHIVKNDGTHADQYFII